MRDDAIVVGGSFAGLSAALYIARARRSVVVVDAGSPRNRFAAESHGFFTHDGSAPAAMLAAARSQVAAYPTARVVEGEAVAAAGEAGVYAAGDITVATAPWHDASAALGPGATAPAAL